MTTHFRFNNGGTIIAFEDAFIRRDLFSTGGLWNWGDNNSGTLGINTSGSGTNASSPVQTIAGGTNWKQVAAAGLVAAAIKNDGTLWAWGSNNYGMLGDNTFLNKSSPIQTISAGTNWKQVAVGNGNIAAIKTDGTLWVWGGNYYGQLGDNTGGPGIKRSSPVQTIAGGWNWKQVSCSSFHVSAIKTDGTLWMWGRNGYGAVGDNTIAVKISPVQTSAGGTTWKQVACGTNSTGAIKTDGTLWTWGRGTSGELGNGSSSVNVSNPQQVTNGGTTWKQVACGYNYMGAIKTDGTLWTWGANNAGQLATGGITSRNIVGQTVSAGTNWKQVYCGTSGFMGALKTNGTLWNWGSNANGELGDTTITTRLSPVQTIAGGTNWKQAAGGQGGRAITDIF